MFNIFRRREQQNNQKKGMKKGINKPYETLNNIKVKIIGLEITMKKQIKTIYLMKRLKSQIL